MVRSLADLLVKYLYPSVFLVGEVEVGLGWDEGSCPAWAGMRNVEAGLGRGEGGSERIREAWGEGGWS